MSNFELAYGYGVKLAAPLHMPNFAVRIVQGAPYHAVHYMPDGYAIYELSYEHLDKNPDSPYHPNNIVNSLKQVPSQAWEWTGANKQASQFDGWASHAALNAGLAARDARYMFDYPGADGALESAKKRLPRLADDIYYGVMPPLMTGHDEADGAAMNRGSLKDWFLWGYNPWDHKDPSKTASVRIVSKIIPMISEQP